MKSRLIYLLIFLCVFLHIQSLQAKEIITPHLEVEEDASAADLSQSSDNLNAKAIIVPEDIEMDTIKLEKGRKFLVVSEQNLNNNTTGVPVTFKSVNNEFLSYNKKPSEITLHGIVEKTGTPRLAGKSATAKVRLQKITIDKITYPVVASISKMDNKNIHWGTLVGTPCYLNNLSDLAEKGIIHTSAKDPCESARTCEISTFAKPAWYIVAAALQTADLLISPFVAFGKRGNNLNIPANTYFEIKLKEDLNVLNI